MIEPRVSQHGVVGGTYRPLEIVQQGESRNGWQGQDTETEQLVYMTESYLPGGLREGTARRTAARILRDSEAMEIACPGKVAKVLDVIEDPGVLWTVAEWIDGTPLDELLRWDGAFDPARAARVGLEILDVLAAAHRAQIIHGDLSPAQVLVGEEGEVTLSGFGLIGSTAALPVTTPAFASPEQARGENAGAASDLWALGAILYALVEGRPPFEDRGNPEATLKAVERLPLRDPENAGPLELVIQGLLRKNWRERLTETVARKALVQVIWADQPASRQEHSLPRVQIAYAAARRASRQWKRRSVIVWGGVAVVLTSGAVVAAAVSGGHIGSSAAGTAPPPAATPSDKPSPSTSSVTARPSDPAGGGNGAAAPPTRDTPPAPPSASASPSISPSPSTSPSPSRTVEEDPLDGFYRYRAPEGFSVYLPKGFERVQTISDGTGAFRAVFGASGDARSLIVTYTDRLRPDPVKVWEKAETDLKRDFSDYERLGDITPVTYHGLKGADMSWLATVDDVRTRTFGRGWLTGTSAGYSLRWTTASKDFTHAANRRALDNFLKTFKEATS